MLVEKYGMEGWRQTNVAGATTPSLLNDLHINALKLVAAEGLEPPKYLLVQSETCDQSHLAAINYTYTSWFLRRELNPLRCTFHVAVALSHQSGP